MPDFEEFLLQVVLHTLLFKLVSLRFLKILSNVLLLRRFLVTFCLLRIHPEDVSLCVFNLKVRVEWPGKVLIGLRLLELQLR